MSCCSDAASVVGDCNAKGNEAICYLQDALQHQVGALQQQLTWLQSHADLQDRINKELLGEVMHLRDAYAAASMMQTITMPSASVKVNN